MFNKGRWIAAFLSVSMIMSMAPVSVFAAQEVAIEEEAQEENSETEFDQESEGNSEDNREVNNDSESMDSSEKEGDLENSLPSDDENPENDYLCLSTNFNLKISLKLVIDRLELEIIY